MANELYLRKELQDNIEPNLGQIGDIVQSMLTEAEFQAIRGSGWALMDGQDVTGTAYAILKTGDAITPLSLPDARGVFLRSASIDNSVDPDGPRLPGDVQSDEFGSHTHSTQASSKPAGGHAHEALDTLSTAPTDIGPGGGTIRNFSLPGSSNTGGNETRPKNIAVNTFIKID